MNFNLKTAMLSLALTLPLTGALSQNWDKYRTQRVESGDAISWDQVSPGTGGYASMLRYHPTIPKKVLLCPDMWNMYLSHDNGASWDGIADDDGNGTFCRLRDMCFSAKDENFALALSSSELYRSDDGANNWEKVLHCPWYRVNAEGGETFYWIQKVSTVAIDPNDTKTWYVAGGGNVRGQLWLSHLRYATQATAHGRDAENMGKLWKTTNGGKSWKLANKGLHEKAQVCGIIIHPDNSNLMFAASNYGIYKSTNGGESWELCSQDIDNNIILDFDRYYDPKTNKLVLYAIDQVDYQPSGNTITCSGGVFTSSDEGQSWQRINGNMYLDVNRLSGGVQPYYFDVLAKWFGVTPQEARKKYPVIPKATLQRLVNIAVDPSREGALYVGVGDPQGEKNAFPPGRLWATTDNGKTWTSTARLFTESWEADKEYWEERGQPWHQNMTLGHESPHSRWGKNYATRTIRGMSVGVDGSIMMVSDHTTSVSTDYGKSWHQVDEDYTPSGAVVGHGNSDMPGHVVAQDKRLETTLLGAGEHRAWIPTYDDPKGRIALKFIKSAPESVKSFAFDPYNPKIAYLTSSRQAGKQYIFRSEDAGHTWERHGVATPAKDSWGDDFYTNALTIDPINSQYMYLGVTKIADKKRANDGGFFRSVDGGKTFIQSNKGLPEFARISDIKLDPRDKSMKSLFIAATAANVDSPTPTEGGLFFSSNRGESWSKVKLPSEIKFVLKMNFDHSGRLYITTGYRAKGNGAWYSDDFGKNWKQIFEYEGAEHIEISPFDRNVIAISVRHLVKNPGIYLSLDRGKTWSKSNKNVIIPHLIEDLKFDHLNAGELWCATLGCGYYKGKIKGGEQIQVIDIKDNWIKCESREKINLSATIVNPKHSGKKIVWRSENDKIAKVNSSGVVEPTGRGNVKIWAITDDGRYADYCEVTVMK